MDLGLLTTDLVTLATSRGCCLEMLRVRNGAGDVPRGETDVETFPSRLGETRTARDGLR